MTTTPRRRRILIVGNGMAGARLAEELRRRDPAAEHFAITVVGEEPHPAYNRVLLSTVVAGTIAPRETRLKPESWWESHGIEVRTGTRVTAVDLTTRIATTTSANGPFEVERVGTPASSPMNRAFGERTPVPVGSNGSFLGELVGTPTSSPPNGPFAERTVVAKWDELVFATGSTPFVPPMQGDTGLESDVVTFRTLDDCARITELAAGARSVVVVGGGLLGLEAARGLLARGLDVTIVHPASIPMERQVDADGGAVLARVVRNIGAQLILGRTVVARTSSTVTLDDGTTLPAELVVIAAGVRPRTDLAHVLGLEVGRGIVVDDRLASSVPHVHAIGECAEHRGEVAGLVQPAWDQARVLADVLSGADPDATYTGTRLLTRLKAHDIDLASMGTVDIDVHDADHEVLAFTDPVRGRYAKLVLHDDRLVGAILLGVGDAAGALTQLYDTASPVPRDRLALMLGRAVTRSKAPETMSLAEMPGNTVICRCNTVTKSHIVAAYRDGAASVPALTDSTRATTGCGSCTSAVDGLCDWLRTVEPITPETSPAPPESLSEGAA